MRAKLIAAAVVAAALWTAATATAHAQARLPGIDVSRFQEEIVWKSVAADGVRFAFVQASRGSGEDCSVVPRECGPDAFYEFNYLGANAAGIRVGPYHRAFVGGRRAGSVRADARAEALVFATAVGELAPGDLRPALDLETPFGDLSPAELRIWARTWLRSVRRKLGVKPLIYTNASSWGALGNPTSFAKRGHPLWVANWDVPEPIVPAHNWAGRGWRVWQHSSSGRVDGITGRVDLDWLQGGWRGVSVRRSAVAR
jgi:lysozyme